MTISFREKYLTPHDKIDIMISIIIIKTHNINTNNKYNVKILFIAIVNKILNNLISFWISQNLIKIIFFLVY